MWGGHRCLVEKAVSCCPVLKEHHCHLQLAELCVRLWGSSSLRTWPCVCIRWIIRTRLYASPLLTVGKPVAYPQRCIFGLGCAFVAQILLNKHDALGLIPSTITKYFSIYKKYMYRSTRGPITRIGLYNTDTVLPTHSAAVNAHRSQPSGLGLLQDLTLPTHPAV